MNHTLEVFGEGQVTLENGETHNVWVITNQQSEERAYVYDEVFADQLVTACNAHEELVKIAQAYRNHLKVSAHTEGEVATYQHINNLLTTIKKGA